MGRSKNSNGNAIMLVAIAVTLVGYIGLFFGRWIKSAVSRQREYLADASAVQFTREPDGIAGALKKIAVYSDASFLHAESEEVSHMLFGSGERISMFATHPPLTERIQRIDQSFQAEDLEQLAKRIQQEGENQTARAAKEQQKNTQQSASDGFDSGNFINEIGSPDFSRIVMAAALSASIPAAINRAAHSGEWATEVLFYCQLDKDAEVREQQLLAVAQHMGSDSESRVRGLLSAVPELAREQRLPLLEIAFPELRRRPPDYVSDVLTTVKALNEADGHTEVFEYLLANLISQHLWESENPQRVRLAGKKSLRQTQDNALEVIAVLAMHGEPDSAAIERAFGAGREALGSNSQSGMPQVNDWCQTLDQALPILDQLNPASKEKLVKALLATAMADNTVVVAEMELLRVVCALIHVPLPMITAAA